jgi:hypothetical protein
MKIPLLYSSVLRKKAAVAAAPGWWTLGGTVTAIGAWAAKGAASQAASYINLANPGTYDLGVGTAPAWDTAVGWTFDGATHNRYLTTGITAGVGWSMIARFGTTATPSGVVGGNYQGVGTTGIYLTPNGGAVNHSYRNGDTQTSVAGVVQNSTLAVCALNCYSGGAADGSIAGNNTAAALTIYIGASNSNGVAASFLNGDLLAIAIYNTTLSVTQVSAIHTAMMSL